MNNNEMSLKELMLAILNRWKTIIVFAIVFAGLLGGYSYYGRLQGMADLQDTYEKEQAAYESTLSSLRTSMVYYSQTGVASEKYNKDSLLMAVDPYNKQTATLSFGINVDAETVNLDISNRMILGLVDLKDALARRVLNQYLLLGRQAPLKSVLKDILPIEYEESYLREMIVVDGADGIITITSTGSSGIDAQRMNELMYSYMLEKQALVTSAAGVHTLEILNQYSIDQVDLALAAKQAEQRTLAAENGNKITELLDEIKTLKENKPGDPTVTPFVIKRSILGAALGFFLGLVMAILLYITHMPVQFPEQIQNQIGIRFLGGVLRRKKRAFLNWSSKLAGEYLMAEEPEAIKIIVANLEEAINGYHKILVTGSLPEKALIDLIQRLSMELNRQDVEFLYGSGINTSADTIRKLAEADAVILAERLQVSRLKTVLQEKERIVLAKKPILGYVFC